MDGQDAEIAAIGELVKLLDALSSDDVRRRVIAYAQGRCIKPAPVINYQGQQTWSGQGLVGALQK